MLHPSIWFEDGVLRLPLLEKLQGGCSCEWRRDRYVVILHILVHFMSPWFVPSYTPTRNGSIPTLGSMPHDKSHQEIEEMRESEHGCSGVIVKHRSQSGKP